MSRRLNVFALILAAAAGSALAQGPAGDPANAVVYELSQGGVVLGEVGTNVVATPDGYASDSFVDLPGLLSLEDVLVTGPDGAAVSYELSGVVRGIQIAMTARFHAGGGSFELTQAGQTASFELASDEPLYVLDNNFIDGFQVIAYEALKRGEPIDVAAVVPQSGALGRVTARLRPEAEPVPVGDASVQATGLDIALTVGPQTVEAVAWLDPDGTIVALDQPMSNIRFAQVDASAGEPQDEAAAAEPRETATELLERTATCVETVGVNVDSTGANLYGLLSLPVNGPASGAPTLVLLPGSGPTDVAGNSLPVITNSGYEQLANLLGCEGYGVLRVAKLGIPPSTGDANAVTLESYAQNTADWFALLAETDGVDASRLGLIGHSEGGLIALYAVANGYVEPDVVVLLATAGRPLGVLLKEQVIASAERGGLDEAAVAVYAEDVDELLEAVRESRGPALEIEGDLEDNQLAPAFAAAAGLLRSEIDVDPVELARQVTMPTIVVQGLKDVQVREVDGDLLANALPDVLHLELPDLTHNLVETRLPAEAMLLPPNDATVSETLVRSLTTFLHGTLRLAR